MINLNDEIAFARKNREHHVLAILQMLKAAFQNYALKKHGNIRTTLNQNEEYEIIRSEIRQRLDSAKQFMDAGRLALSMNEDTEAKILEQYLPIQITAAELSLLVIDTLSELGSYERKIMGKALKSITEKIPAGTCDPKRLSELLLTFLY
jgi:hypothetical protein